MAKRLPGTKRERLRDLRKTAHLSYAELGKRTGCSETTLSRYEEGTIDRMGDDLIRRLAREFNVSIDFLMGETDIPDRRNYDISELGLSAEAARRLYTGKLNVEVVNRILENPKFPAIALMIAQYFHDTYAAGFAARNQILDMTSSFLLSQASDREKTEEAVMNIHVQTVFASAHPKTQHPHSRSSDQERKDCGDHQCCIDDATGRIGAFAEHTRFMRVLRNVIFSGVGS